MRCLAALILILAQRIQVGGPPATPPVFTLTLDVTGRAGEVMQHVKVSLVEMREGDGEVVVAEKIVDRCGRAQFSNLPTGRYMLVGRLGGFLDTRIGPLSLNPDVEIPTPLKLVMNEFGIY